MGGERLKTMSEEIRKIMRSFLDSADDRNREACWCPSVDLYRGKSQWLAKFDLAGVRPEEVHLRVQGRHLTVRGSRRDASLIQGQVAHSMEISYSTFERTIELPFEIDPAQVSTEYRDGMLLVHIAARSHHDE